MEKISISTDRSLLNVEFIHSFLANSYWAKDIPLDTVIKSMENSLCFGIYENNNQVGFARVISDFTTFAYLADVFIIPEKQGAGLGQQLLKAILNHEDLQGLKRWHLVTRDAQTLYSKFGFSNPENPVQHMEKVVKNIYSVVKDNRS